MADPWEIRLEKSVGYSRNPTAKERRVTARDQNRATRGQDRIDQFLEAPDLADPAIPGSIHEEIKGFVADHPLMIETDINAALQLAPLFNKPFKEVYADLDNYKKAFDVQSGAEMDTVIQDWKNAVRRGRMVNRRGELGFKLLEGEGFFPGAPVDQTLWDDIDELEKEMEGLEASGQGNFLQRGISQALELLPMMGKGMEEGAKVAMFGMMAGAAMGAPAAGVGAAPGAVVGFTGGMAIGAGRYTYRVESGNFLIDMLKMQDEKGGYVNPRTARIAAVGVGFLNALIETAQISDIVASIPGMDKVVRNVVTDTAKKIIAEGSLQHVLLKRAGHVLTETGEEALQEVVSHLGQEAVIEGSNRTKGTKFEAAWDQLAPQVLQVIKKTAGGFAILQLPGTFVDVAMSDFNKAANTTEEQVIAETADRIYRNDGEPAALEYLATQGHVTEDYEQAVKDLVLSAEDQAVEKTFKEQWGQNTDMTPEEVEGGMVALRSFLWTRGIQPTKFFVDYVDRQIKADFNHQIEAPSPDPVPTQTAIPSSDIPVVEIPVKDVSLSKDVPQFKEDASETGVVEAIQADKYQRLGTAPIVVWERLNGEMEVITGRHRLDLAQRLGEDTIPAQIVRESEGFSQKQAAIFDAEANIRDGQGSVKDYANYFRHTEISLTEASSRGLLSRAKGRNGFAIGAYAENSLYTLYRNGKIGEKKAAAIAAGAPNNDQVQALGIKKAKELTEEELGQYVKILQSAGSDKKARQENLFGDDESFIIEAERIAKAAAKQISDLKDELRTLKKARSLGDSARAELLEQYGFKSGDEAALSQRILELDEKLQAWESWSTNPEIMAELRSSRMPGGPDTLFDNLTESEYIASKRIIHGSEKEITSVFDAVQQELDFDGQQSLPYNEKILDPGGSRTTAGRKRRVSKVRTKIEGDWKKHRRIDLTGAVVDSPKDVAQLFSVYRHPRLEHFHIIYLDENNKILAHNAMSSGLPARTLAVESRNIAKTMYNIEDRMRRLGATQMYLLHNHPSGNVEASPADFGVTEMYGENLAGFVGHVIIDHDKYNYITYLDSLSRTIDEDMIKPYEGGTEYNPEVKTAPQVKSPDHVAQIAFPLFRGGLKQLLLALNDRNKVVAAIPLYSDTVKLQEVRQKLKAAGSLKGIYVTTQKETYERNLKIFQTAKGTAEDYILDVMAVGENAYTSAIEQNVFLGQPAAEDIAAKNIKPGWLFQAKPMEDPDALKEWFGNSKIVDKDGNPKVVYHGTPDVRDILDEGFTSSTERLQRKGYGHESFNDPNRAFFFAADKPTAESYADDHRAYDYQGAEPKTLPVYLKIENPLVVDWKGKPWHGTRASIKQAQEEGRDGIIINNVIDNYTGSGKATTVYATFSSQQIKSVDNRGTFDLDDPNIFLQNKDNLPIAAVSFNDMGKATLHASRAANFSSFIHEMGHVWRRMLTKPELAVFEKWIADSGTLVFDEDGNWTREAEEMFANGLEQYLKESTAPTSHIAALWDKFTAWLKDIYERFAKMEMNEEVKQAYEDLFEWGTDTTQEEPPGMPPPPPHPPDDSEMGEAAGGDKSGLDLAGAYERLKESWFRDRDEWVHRSKTKRTRNQEQLKGRLGIKRYNDEAKKIDLAMAIYYEMKFHPDAVKYVEQLTDEEKEIYELSQNLPEAVQRLADEIGADFHRIGTLALGAEVIGNTLEGYVGHLWDLEHSTEGPARKFKPTTEHAKARVFDTILQGWAAGFTLKIKGMTNQLQTIEEILYKTIYDKYFLDAMRKAKDVDGNPLVSTKHLENYEALDNRHFKKWDYAGTVSVEVFTKTVRQVIAQVAKETRSTEEGGDAAVGGTSKPIKALEEIITSAMEQRGMTKPEAANALEKVKTAATKIKTTGDTKAQVETIIKEIREAVIERELVTGYEFDPVYSHDTMVTPDGVVLSSRPLYAPEKIAKNLNRILGTSKLAGIPAIQAMTKYNAVMKNWILQSSFFHHLAYTRSYMLGTNKKKFSEMNLPAAAKAGLEAIKQDNPLIILGIRNGLTLGVVQDWDEHALESNTAIDRIIDKVPMLKKVKTGLKWFRDVQTNFLFQKMGAGLKAKAFLIEYRNHLRKHPDLDPNVIANDVANLINDDFGGLHLQRMGRDPTVQHIMRFFLLAPDWTESNIRSMAKIFKAGPAGQAYRAFWAGILMKGLAITTAANFALAGGDPERLLENYRIAWEAGANRTFHIDVRKLLGIDITPIYRALGGTTAEHKYFSILGHFIDPFKFITDPFRSAHHKGSVIFGTFYEAISGADWAGRQFTDLEELLATGETVKWGPGHPLSYPQIPSYILSQIIGTQPVQVQNLLAWLAGEMEGFDAITNSLGLGTSTTYNLSEKAKPKKSSAKLF